MAFLGRSSDSAGQNGFTRRSMSAASSLLKPFAGFPVASLDAVTIAIAEANVELSSEHALFRSSKIPAKTRGAYPYPPRAPMEAVSEIVSCLRSRPLESPRSRRPADGRFQVTAPARLWLKDFDNGCKWACFWVSTNLV